ncbi:hypothetical protein Agabi119p4_8127 [Agaricus bisporus var. burnettii]|uniref:Uncharacterized protein n=1 Tax=Agaricus bisporus var. burnettii TaxID=192524 RepID=A0A8H7EY79_AGABI|nr:hypothetical protein Agabi119p4_8127 [Agaricus bisporus var. burnettii]
MSPVYQIRSSLVSSLAIPYSLVVPFLSLWVLGSTVSFLGLEVVPSIRCCRNGRRDVFRQDGNFLYDFGPMFTGYPKGLQFTPI